MKRLQKHWPTFVAMLINLIGMLLFASAFFSVDDRMLSESEVTEFRSSLPLRMQQLLAKMEITCSPHYSTPAFTKLVFVVIDALRADFIPSISPGDLFATNSDSPVDPTMPFLEQLIQSNAALPLISEAQTPTVTMPRIKALLSGTYPSFMDLVMNLKAAKFGDDNVLEHLHRKGKRIVFFGDDTWLQMFPASMFVRSEGTSSFFATDYTSVDTNVTDRVFPELQRLKDWDVMILHYLGLDHIGHSYGGAYSKLVRPKLLEMDHIIAEICKSLSSSGESYLVVVTGDHGMTDAGNHGGSSREESETAAVFLNTSRMQQPSSSQIPAHFSGPRSKIMQIDMAITLSALFALPVPEKSRGKIILPVLSAMNVRMKGQLCHMNRNALHMQKMMSSVVKSEINLFFKALSTHQEYLTSGSQTAAAQSLKLYASYIDKIQRSLMTGKAYKSLFSFLSVGIVLSLVSCVMLMMVENSHIDGDGKSIMKHLFRKNTTSRIFAAHLLLQVTCLASTSFTELESYYWHYAISSLVVYHFVFEYLRKSYARMRSGLGKNVTLHEAKNETEDDVLRNHMPSPKTFTSSHSRSLNHLNHRNKNRDRRCNQQEETGHYENGNSSSGNGFIDLSFTGSSEQTLVSGDAADSSNHHNNRHSDHDDRRSQGYLFLPFIPRPVIYVSVLLLLRISTSWTAVITNAVDPVSRDIRSFLASEDQKHLLSALVILTFFILTFLTPSTRVGKQHCILGAGFFFIYLFRTEEGSCTLAGFPVKILPEVGLDFSIPSVTKARIVYILILGIIVDAVLQRLKWISDDFISKYTQDWLASLCKQRRE